LGIDLNSAQLLIRAKANGASFDRVGTMGRQGLHANRPALLSILRNNSYRLDAECQRRLLDPSTVYAEEFFRLLGAKEVIAIDASGYEGAQVVHDMNQPLPEHLASSFDLFLDGGTLEHLFDFRTASKNCMLAVRRGGRFVSVTTANNFCGHGFYQFSPELFYRLLSEQSGYEMESCIIWEDVHGSAFYQVPDPASLRTRIELTSRKGTFMYVQAQRVGDTPASYIPHQSDYVRHWEASKLPPGETPSGSSRSIRTALKKIPLLQTSVLQLRAFLGESLLRRHVFEREYDRRLIHKNSRRVLRRLDGISVKL
jgi:hypothetical protein